MMKRSNTACAAIAAAPLAGVASVCDAQADDPMVFVAHAYAQGATVAAFRVQGDGTLELVDEQPTGVWSYVSALSPDGSTLMVGNAAGTSDGDALNDEMFLFEVASDGSLTQVHRQFIPKSQLAATWLADDVIAVMNTDLGNSIIYTYRWDGDALVQLDAQSTFGFTTSLAYHAPSRRLYAPDSNTDSIWVFEVDAATGDLDFVTVASTAPYFALDVQLNGTGGRLYGAAGISGDVVAGFALDPGGVDELAPLPAGPYASPGDSPAYLAFVRGGDVLAVGHGRDATVRTFLVDPESGDLAYSGHVFDVGSQGSIGDIASLGDLLFVTDDSSVSDSVNDAIGMYCFRIGADGSFTQIGPLYDTGNRRPEARLAVWDPAGACRVDLNDDGAADFFDVSAFLAAFNAGDLAADFNGDGLLDFFDVSQFLALFNAGC